MSSNASVIDLSHHNTVTSFKSIKGAGILGVIHKATQGTSYVDPTYKGRMAEALAAGLCWGAYHFLTEAPAADQMAWFLKNAGLPNGSRIVLDYEDDDLTISMLHDCLDYLSINAPSMQICIYSGHLIKEQLTGMPKDEDLAS